jgi:hypothetical protein
MGKNLLVPEYEFLETGTSLANWMEQPFGVVDVAAAMRR